MKKEKVIKYLLIIASILISGVIIYFRNDLAKLQGYGILGILLISILGNATVVIPAPVILTAFIGGSVYNPVLVGLVVAIGATIGELTGFMAGIGGQVAITNHKHFKKVEGWMMKSGFLTIFVLATIPNPLFDLAGIFSGATNYPIKKFLLATFLGKSIKFLTVALLGNSFF
ncbi:MAG: VTT domain-containing protein [Candidatus Woesebacteria bacterium]|nr:VTT domain-containing protein [Candidatus Woesebacteria bacterium]